MGFIKETLPVAAGAVAATAALGFGAGTLVMHDVAQNYRYQVCDDNPNGNPSSILNGGNASPSPELCDEAKLSELETKAMAMGGIAVGGAALGSILTISAYRIQRRSGRRTEKRLN
jgi:hypothetical protein